MRNIKLSYSVIFLQKKAKTKDYRYYDRQEIKFQKSYK